MKVVELWRYPVKGLRGERLEQVEVAADGIPGDRGLAVVDERGIVTGRRKQRMIGVPATLDDAGETLVDGRPWNSPEAAATIRDAAGDGAKLTRPAAGHEYDEAPILLLSDGSIDQLGYDHRRFRPNIYFEGAAGPIEQEWLGRQVHVGDLVLSVYKRDVRCVITTIDPDTIEVDLDVLKRTNEELDGVMGVYCTVVEPAVVRIGDRSRLCENRFRLMAPTEKVTYCRVCEPLCGMIATVDDGELVKVRPDPDHPLSAGFACPKGIAMAEVQNDPDRVLFPQRRRPDGSFERVTWDEALDDIGSRLKAIVDRDGGEAVGWYMGNPGAFSYSHPLWVKGFLDALGSPHSYTASSQDVSNRFAASWFLYGSPFIVPIPDLERTDFLLVVGANPLVSHGSVLSAPRIKDQLHAITDRGGRVVVVDPRRSETARAFEHVSIDPDGDAWLLLSMLEVIFAEGLEDRSALERQTRGSRALRALVADFPPEATEAALRRIGARGAPTRPGPRGRQARGRIRAHRILPRPIRDAGLVPARCPQRGNWQSRSRGRGDVRRPARRLQQDRGPRWARHLLEGSLARRRPARGPRLAAGVCDGEGDDDAGQGPDQGDVRLGRQPGALRSQRRRAGGGDGGPGALGRDRPIRDRHVAALRLRPARDDDVRARGLPAAVPCAVLQAVHPDDASRSSRHAARRGRSGRSSRRSPSGSASFHRACGWLASPAERESDSARAVLSTCSSVPVRRATSSGCAASGLSVAKLARNPHGMVLADHLAPDVLAKQVRSRDGRVRLDAPEIRDEVMRLQSLNGHDPDFPLRLIGLRELRSHNSWMHNAPLLMRGGRTHSARIHPDDAERLGIDDGARCRIASAHGSIEIEATITDEVKPGTVAVPHGWGHQGGWQVANAAGGANTNVLASSDPADLEPLAGMAHLNGIAIRVEPAELPRPLAAAQSGSTIA